MSAALLLLVSIALLGLGYILYGRFLARKFDIDPGRTTPSHIRKDGVDYLPARWPVLFGHHFSSIAGAGPILGPIYAAVFGWIPVLLWVVLGSIFMGGVHDFAALVASIRHGGKSIGEVIEERTGRSGKRLFLMFSWWVIVLVVAVFVKAVASIFVKDPATSTSSGMLILLAILTGFGIYRLRVPLAVATLIGVVAVFGCILAGLVWPLVLPFQTWVLILFAYISIAAVVPVWILLQPRDYLNSFLLYAVLLAGMVGILVTNPQLHMPSIGKFHTDLGYMFPMLFVTVACGAISGFHSLVSSGTTAKQLDSERDAIPVAYGAMIVEGVLAVVALITAVTLLQSDYVQMIAKEGGGPIGIFATGIGRFMASVGIPEQAGVTFAALAISAFALTSLDTATRLARFAFQEFFESYQPDSVLAKNRFIATLITVGMAALLTYSGTSDTIWPLFGSVNQLLALISLLAVTVWLSEIKEKTNFVKIPMYFMFVITLSAQINLIYKTSREHNYPLLAISLILFAVAIIFIYRSRKQLQNNRQ